MVIDESEVYDMGNHDQAHQRRLILLPGVLFLLYHIIDDNKTVLYNNSMSDYVNLIVRDISGDYSKQ